MKEQRVDIMMMTYGRLDYTKKTLDSLLKNTSWPYRLVVTDNCSVDGTREYLEECLRKGHIQELILEAENPGNAVGKNLELQRATTPYVCLLDNDMYLEQDWLRRPMEAMQHFANERLVLMSPWPIWLFGPNTKIGELKSKHHDGVFLTRKLSGQVWIGVRKVLLKCGGFEVPKDKRFMGFFASPLSKKLVKAGYRIGCIADAILAVSMDREGSPMRVKNEMLTAYREWNRLQKNKHQTLSDFHVWWGERKRK